MTLISEKGELVLKNQSIGVIPKSFYSMKFEKILTLDI